MDISTIKAELIEALAAHLAPARLVDLEVMADVDHDGDPILRARAVYDDQTGHLDGERMFTAPRLLRDRLEGIGEIRFPILTFISLHDRTAEAA